MKEKLIKSFYTPLTFILFLIFVILFLLHYSLSSIVLGYGFPLQFTGPYLVGMIPPGNWFSVPIFILDILFYYISAVLISFVYKMIKK